MTLKKIFKAIVESYALAANIAYPLPPDALREQPEKPEEAPKKEPPKDTPRP
jgi:hypothetical protein